MYLSFHQPWSKRDTLLQTDANDAEIKKNSIQSVFHTSIPNSVIFQESALSKLGLISEHTVRNFKFCLQFYLIGICLKKCAKFAPFLMKTKI